MKIALNVPDGNLAGARVYVGDRVTVRVGKNGHRSAAFPAGSIGANVAKRNYVKSLVERYHRFREADADFGRSERFLYSALFTSIEAKFGAPTYFIPEARFGELVDFLQDRVDDTMLGRVNAKRGIPNYGSFDEYLMQDLAAPVAG